MNQIRNYLYLNSKLAAEFVAQIQGGEVASIDHRSTSDRKKGGNAGLKAGPATVGIDYSSGGTDEVSYSVTPNDASNVSAVAELAGDDGFYDEMDEATWGSMPRQSVVELQLELKAPLFQTFSRLITEYADLAPHLGADSDEDMDQIISFTSALALDRKPLAYVGTFEDDDEYKFLLRLDRNFLTGSAEDIESGVTVLAKVAKKSKPHGKKWRVEQLGSIGKMLPEAQFSKMHDQVAKQNSDNDSSLQMDVAPSFLEHPAIELTVVAIYT